MRLGARKDQIDEALRMRPLVKIAINILIEVKEENGEFCVKCPYLNVVTSGKSEAQAIEHLKEEIEFLFFSCESVKELVAVVDERSSKCKEPLARKDFVRIETTYVDLPSNVPLELLKRFADVARNSP
jgi:predicted RNase H-like HicB family nuclease